MVKLIDILQRSTGCESCQRPAKKTLVEAYDQATIDKYVKKFSEEAEDLGIDISNQQLKSYIKLFDKVKETLPGEQKKIENWSLPKFIKFVTKSAAGKRHQDSEEIEITPDVVYHNDDDTIVIYNGSTEANCIKYGKGEKWCITKSSFAGYRYSKDNPTFYLAKNNNLPETDDKSFVAIQVLNPATTREDKRYKYTLRPNRGDIGPLSYEDLLLEVPWLNEIPNLRTILKHIPLTPEEKFNQEYKNRPLTYREWTNLPYKYKEQYLVSRKDKTDKFSDISDALFISKYLNNYPDIRNFIAVTPGLFEPTTLLQNFEELPDSARRSIVANLGGGLPVSELQSSSIPFEVKKLLVKLKKWKVDLDEKLYITKDNDTIVKLKIDNDGINMGLYQADDDFPNVKLNKRTSKYLVDYPELTQIPFSYLYELNKNGVIDFEVIEKVVEDVKEKPNSDIAVEETEDGTYILDSGTLNAFKVGDRKIEEVPFKDEQVQSIFKSSTDSNEFKKNALSIFTRAQDTYSQSLPKTTNVSMLASMVSSLPYKDRQVNIPNRYSEETVPTVLFADNLQDTPVFFFMEKKLDSLRDYLLPYRMYKGTKRIDSKNSLTPSQYSLYFNYLRDQNVELDDNIVKNLFRSYSGSQDSLKNFFKGNPPLKPTNVLKPVIANDTLYLLDTRDRRNNFKINPATGNFVRANISQANYNQLLGVQQQGAGQRVQQAQARWQQPAPVGNINIQQTMQGLNALNQFLQIPVNDRRRLNIANGAPLNVTTDGGARRRNQLLGNAGRVTQAYAALTSRIYVIRLANGTNVISIKVYPGNREYLLIPGQRAYQLNQPNELLTLLRQNNLAEVRKYLVNSYMDTNPTNLEEFKNLLRQHLNK